MVSTNEDGDFLVMKPPFDKTELSHTVLLTVLPFTVIDGTIGIVHFTLPFELGFDPVSNVNGRIDVASMC